MIEEYLGWFAIMLVGYGMGKTIEILFEEK